MSDRTKRVIKLGLVVVIVALAVASLIAQRADLETAAVEIEPTALLLALAFAMMSLGSSGLAWRALLSSRERPVTVRVGLSFFLFSQLGKYLPGGLGPAIAQASLADDFEISRVAAAQAYLVFAAQTVVLGVIIGAATLPFSQASLLSDYWWVFAGTVVVVPLLHPALMHRALTTVAARLRPSVTINRMTNRAAATSAAWTGLTWLFLGLHAATIASAFEPFGVGLLLLTIGGYCFAWVAGFMILFLPAGLGAREVILVAALSTSMSVSNATVVAVASRVLVTLADLIIGLIAASQLGFDRRARQRNAG